MLIDKYQGALGSSSLLTQHISKAGAKEDQGLLKKIQIQGTVNVDLFEIIPASLTYFTAH